MTLKRAHNFAGFVRGSNGRTCHFRSDEQQLRAVRDRGRRGRGHGTVGRADGPRARAGRLLDMHKVQKSEEQSDVSVLRKVLSGNYRLMPMLTKISTNQS